jgi:hypothetical protein
MCFNKVNSMALCLEYIEWYFSWKEICQGSEAP